jgi:hypothetical protein
MTMLAVVYQVFEIHSSITSMGPTQAIHYYFLFQRVAYLNFVEDSFSFRSDPQIIEDLEFDLLL